MIQPDIVEYKLKSPDMNVLDPNYKLFWENIIQKKRGDKLEKIKP